MPDDCVTAPTLLPQSPAQSRTTLIPRGPVLPTMLKLAAPNLVVRLTQALANFLESHYAGLIGVDALAGPAPLNDQYQPGAMP